MAARMLAVSETFAKPTRRAFFGRVLGGALAVLGVNRAVHVENLSTGRWHGMVPEGASNYTASDLVVPISVEPQLSFAEFMRQRDEMRRAILGRYGLKVRG